MPGRSKLEKNQIPVRRIGVTELALRDAHQSLLATRLSLDDMVGACEDIDQAGFWSVECWGGATYDACIRFLNEDPWVRLRTFRALMPNTRLQMLLRGQNLLGYRPYGDEVVGRFVEKSAENGMDVFRVFDALNDPRNMAQAMRAVVNTGKHAQGTICYTISPVHTVEGYVHLAGQLLDMGAQSIAIKDMAALLRPRPAYDIVRGIKETYGEHTQINVHCHATTGVTMVSLMSAIEAGADVVDTAISSLSLGPGHNPTESLVEMLDGTPYTTGLDMVPLRRVRDHFAAVRPRYKAFESATLVDTDMFESQIPGGMLSNMESQLKAQGAGDRLKEVMAEVPVIKADCGHPPLVTPMSQIVGVQAVFNVLFGRYEKITAEFADLVLGYYGATAGEVNPEVISLARQQAHKEPITCRPADLLEPEWGDLVAHTKALAGNDGTDEDVLTYTMFPAVAPEFFAHRADGPHSAAGTPAPPDAALAARPITYKVSLGGRQHTVKVERA